MNNLHAKKILHVITTAGVGGAELMLCRLLERNDPSRHRQAVLTLLTPHALKERMEASAPIYSLDMRPPLPTVGNLRRLRAVIRDYRPDLIQGWMYHGNIAATIGAGLAGFAGPVLWNIRHSLHDIAYEKPVSRMVIRLNAWLSRRPRAILFNSRTSIEQHESLGFAPDRSLFLPNGVDCALNRPRPEIRDEMRAELGIDRDAPVIGMVARYHPMKDPDNLLQALARIAERLPAVQLVVAGRDYEQVQGSIAGLGLENRVHLLGSRDDVPRILAAIDVVAMPSAWGEGFPNALGEAAAAGVPAVATDIGDAARVIGDGGRIVPPRDSEALAAALTDILTLDPAERRRLGERARRHVESHFELDVIARRFAALHDLFLDPSNRETPPPDLLSRFSLSGPSD